HPDKAVTKKDVSYCCFYLFVCISNCDTWNYNHFFRECWLKYDHRELSHDPSASNQRNGVAYSALQRTIIGFVNWFPRSQYSAGTGTARFPAWFEEQRLHIAREVWVSLSLLCKR
ncbi:MAG: hypothetical protein ACUVUA_17260, partial [Chloroflexus sp.]|uniref:hypothetical protein n=1 Tax=Chloroflexus sp. TaxID=1904827 RepID=UPI00404A5FEE